MVSVSLYLMSHIVDYSATKGAITTFTRSLAVQLAPKGIRVNGVAPGPIITSLQAASRPPENMEGLGAGETPLHNRAGQPAETGPTYVFLASSDSNIMTGQIIHINSEPIFSSLRRHIAHLVCRRSTCRSFLSLFIYICVLM